MTQCVIIFLLERRLEYDVKNHIRLQLQKVDNTKISTPTSNSAMSKEQQNRPLNPNISVTAKLNQATPSSTGTPVPTTSNVIQTNNKNTMMSSFVSVIEGTKDLSISDEKQRSPKHQQQTQKQGNSKTTSTQPKQHPLLENTNLNDVATKLPAAPTVITQFPTLNKSGDAKGYKSVSYEKRRRSLQGSCGSTGPLLEETEQQMVTITAGNIPLPTKCSAQLRRLLQAHSVNIPPPRILDSTSDQLKQLAEPQKTSRDNSQTDKDQSEENGSQAISNAGCNENIPALNNASSFPPHSTHDTRPIYPHLPYSPYSSPTTSPRTRRKPLRETTRVNSINDQSGEFVQLNQYKVEGAIGQGSFGIVKLCHNDEDDNTYAMKILSKKKLKRKAGVFGKLSRALPNRRVSPGGPEKKAP
jgi:hypothetical protein